jgi:uncharacterized protein (TIGR02452 family)
LSYASVKSPGGAFLAGSAGQEEGIARSSAYYACLVQNTAMYDYNLVHKDPFYSDHISVCPNIPVFRNEFVSLNTILENKNKQSVVLV